MYNNPARARQFLKYQNDLQFALDHQDQFPGVDTRKISDQYDEISAEVSKVVDAARSCFTDLTRCSIPSVNLSLLENILPPQTVTSPPPPPPPPPLPKIHKLGILYNYGGDDTALFVFPAGEPRTRSTPL